MPRPSPPASPPYSRSSVDPPCDSDHSRSPSVERGRPRTRRLRCKRAMADEAEHATGPFPGKRQRIAALDQNRTPALYHANIECDRSESPSKSPIRKQLSLLSTAEPPVNVTSGGMQNTDPTDALDLFGELNGAAEQARIPGSFKGQKQFDKRCAKATISDAWFSEPAASDGSQDQEQDAMLMRTCRILDDAARCSDGPPPQDENAWSEVVRLVIRTALYGCDEDRAMTEALPSTEWRLLNIQSQPMADRFLPQKPGTPSKRTDIALYASPNADGMSELADLHHRAMSSDIPMSHMKDQFSSTVPVAVPFEVKAINGNQEEAQLQLAIFCAAAVQYLDTVVFTSSTVPVQLGWTVQGHRWSLWFVWKDDGGHVHVRNSSLDRNLGTSSFKDLFVLIAVLRRMREWLSDVYWKKYLEAFKVLVPSNTPANKS